MSASEAGETAPLDLEAIRGRGEAALVTLNDQGRYRTLLWWACIEDDIPALIAEVERLRAALSGRAASEPVAWRVTERWLDGTIHHHLFHTKPTPWEYCDEPELLGIIGAPGDSEAQRVALEQAARWFREYEEIHARKARHSGVLPMEADEAERKAARNRERAEFCERAIAAGVGAPEGQRIEGIAFEDDDSFCTGAAPDRCQESYTFVPECEHESADEMARGGDRRATLIIHAEPVAPADGREGER